MDLLGRRKKPAYIDGHRILFVDPSGPAASVGLVPYLDLITEISPEGQLDDADKSLISVIGNHIDQPTTMTIYNCKTALSRQVVITPNRNWGGKGVLGLVARFDPAPLTNLQHFRVTEILQGGPANDAGLRAVDDFLLGTERLSLGTEDVLRRVLGTAPELGSEPPTLLFYVYNEPTDSVRTVALVPSFAPLAPPETTYPGPGSAPEHAPQRAIADNSSDTAEEAGGTLLANDGAPPTLVAEGAPPEAAAAAEDTSSRTCVHEAPAVEVGPALDVPASSALESAVPADSVPIPPSSDVAEAAPSVPASDSSFSSLYASRKAAAERHQGTQVAKEAGALTHTSKRAVTSTPAAGGGAPKQSLLGALAESVAAHLHVGTKQRRASNDFTTSAGPTTVAPALPAGVWWLFYGLRTEALPGGLPKSGSLGRPFVAGVTEFEPLYGAAGLVRLERLGCADLFTRLTVAAPAVTKGAAEKRGSIINNSVASAALAVGLRMSPARPGAKGRGSLAPHEDHTAEDTDDRSRVAALRRRIQGRGHRETRAAMKKRSAQKAMQSAAAMGIQVAGSGEEEDEEDEDGTDASDNERTGSSDSSDEGAGKAVDTPSRKAKRGSATSQTASPLAAHGEKPGPGQASSSSDAEEQPVDEYEAAAAAAEKAETEAAAAATKAAGGGLFKRFLHFGSGVAAPAPAPAPAPCTGPAKQARSAGAGPTEGAEASAAAVPAAVSSGEPAAQADLGGVRPESKAAARGPHRMGSVMALLTGDGTRVPAPAPASPVSAAAAAAAANAALARVGSAGGVAGASLLRVATAPALGVAGRKGSVLSTLGGAAVQLPPARASGGGPTLTDAPKGGGATGSLDAGTASAAAVPIAP